MMGHTFIQDCFQVELQRGGWPYKNKTGMERSTGVSPGHGKPHDHIDMEGPGRDFHLVLGCLKNQHFTYSSKESPGTVG